VNRLENYSTEIIEIVDETYDVKTFKFKKPEGYTFIPGQFTMISFDNNGPEGKKPFTFSNSPADDHIEMTIKEVGSFTKALFKLGVGDNIFIQGPRGTSLNFDDSITNDIVFLAGGSGITPFISILRYAVKKNLPNKFLLLFGNRLEKDIIYRQELDDLNKQDNIEVFMFITEKVVNWTGELGFIDKEKIINHVPMIRDKLFYICGPPIMNHVMVDLLHELHISDDMIKIDKGNPW